MAKTKGANYFLIFVGLVLAGILAFIVFVMFNPGKEFLGYTWKEAATEKSLNALVESDVALPFDEVYIESNFMSVEFDARNLGAGAGYKIFIIDETTGLAKYGKHTFQEEYKIENRVLSLKVIASPEGLLWGKSNSKIIFAINHDSKDLMDKKYTFKSTSGNITLGAIKKSSGVLTKEIEIKNLSAESETGNIIATNLFTVSGEGAALLKSKKGDISFKNNITAENIVLENTNGTLSVQDLTGNVTINGEISKSVIKNIVGDVIVNKSAGMLNIDKISGTLTLSETADMIALTVTEVTGAILVKDSDKAKIKIDKILADAEINNKNGTNDFNEVLGNLTVVSENASTAVAQMKNFVNIETKKGNVSLTFALNIEIEANSIIKTMSGNVKLINVVSGIEVTTTSGGVNAAIIKNIGAISIKTESGDINVSIKNTAENAFILKTESNNAVNVSVGAIVYSTKEAKSSVVNGYAGSENVTSLKSNTGKIAATTLEAV